MLTLINLSQFCDFIGEAQAGSIQMTLVNIAAKYDVEPMAQVEGVRGDGAVFHRPLFTREQAQRVIDIEKLESDLKAFQDLRAAVEKMGAGS